jgi:hypothetical protein
MPPCAGLWVRVWYLTHIGTTIQAGLAGVGAAGLPALEWTDSSVQALPGSRRNVKS